MSSGYPADVEVAHEAIDRAVDELLELMRALYERESGAGGRTYGTQDMDREQRIEAFLVDAQSGALDILKSIAPEHYNAQVRQFQQDVAASPVVRGI